MAAIPMEFLQKLRRIDLEINRLVQDLFAGKYRSVFRGRGLYFEELREYSIGDDVRRIDWNASARTNELYVRLYREERELSVILMVDVSGSTDFGSVKNSKREQMAELAAVLAFSAEKNNDRVGLILFTDEVEHFVYPDKGHTHVIRLIRDILYYQPKRRGTNTTKALWYLNNVLSKNALVFLISDFHDDSPYQRAMQITNQRHDLVPILLEDPREMTLPNVGWIAVQDAETGEIVEVNTSSRRTRDRFVKSAAARHEALRKACGKGGIDLVRIEDTSRDSYVRAMMAFFRHRKRRR